MTAAVDQYAANQRSLTTGPVWAELKTAAPRVQRARQRADAAKEALIARCGTLANTLALSDDEDEGNLSEEAKTARRTKVGEENGIGGRWCSQ